MHNHSTWLKLAKKFWYASSDFTASEYTWRAESESCIVVSTLCDPMDSSMEFSRPEYWSG